MNLQKLPEAVLPAASTEYVKPLEVGPHPAPLAVRVMWVDVYGGLWFKSNDENLVVLPRKDWETLGELVNFAANYNYPDPEKE